MTLAILVILAGATVALGCAAWLLPRWRRLRRYSDLPEVHWIRPGDSPLGRRVLDCRSYCRLMPGPPHERISARFAATRRAPLSDLVGRLPEGAHPAGRSVAWRFNEGELRRLRAGFLAADVEDRWLIRHGGGRLYFQRSWTGGLVYVAELEADGAGGRVSRLWLRGGDEGSAESDYQGALQEAIARFLIDSHLLGRTAAVPVPRELASEPQKMALFAFSIAGRRGEYAEPFWPLDAHLN